MTAQRPSWLLSVKVSGQMFGPTERRGRYRTRLLEQVAAAQSHGCQHQLTDGPPPRRQRTDHESNLSRKADGLRNGCHEVDNGVRSASTPGRTGDRRLLVLSRTTGAPQIIRWTSSEREPH